MGLKSLLIELNETNRKIEMLQSDTPESRAFIENKAKEIFQGRRFTPTRPEIDTFLSDLFLELEEAY